MDRAFDYSQKILLAVEFGAAARTPRARRPATPSSSG